MLVRVTGGISRELGRLYPADGTAVCGIKPVRTIGGWRRLDTAGRKEPLASQVGGIVGRAQSYHSAQPLLSAHEDRKNCPGFRQRWQSSSQLILV